MYTDGHNTERRTHGQNDQSHNLLQFSLRSHLAEIKIRSVPIFSPTATKAQNILGLT